MTPCLVSSISGPTQELDRSKTLWLTRSGSYEQDWPLAQHKSIKNVELYIMGCRDTIFPFTFPTLLARYTERENATKHALCSRNPDEIGPWAEMLTLVLTDEGFSQEVQCKPRSSLSNRREMWEMKFMFIQNKLDRLEGGRGPLGIAWLIYCRFCPMKRPSIAQKAYEKPQQQYFPFYLSHP